MSRAVAALLGGVFAFAAGQAEAAPDPRGFWLTENERSIIELYDCESGLCGRIAWIIEGGMQYDTANPDDSLHDRPLCGLDILRDFQPDSRDDAKWVDGEIYKADDGDVYSARLRMVAEDVLDVRGFVGISLFGSSQDWTRVSADDFERCAPPNPA